METLHNITNISNQSDFRIRLTSIVAGVLIAIICALISLKNFNANEANEATVHGSIETPTFVKADLLVKAAASTLILVKGK